MCLSQVLHKSPCTRGVPEEAGGGAHPYLAGQVMAYLLVTDLPKDAPFSNCTKTGHLLATALPTLFPKPWKSPVLAAASCRGKVSWVDRGQHYGTYPNPSNEATAKAGRSKVGQRFGEPMFPTAVSRKHLLAPLLRAGCSHSDTSRVQGVIQDLRGPRRKESFLLFL